MDINNRRIVLTGAASGIGAALLARLAEYDCSIVTADLRPLDSSALDGKAARVMHHACDLSTQHAVDGLFDFALETMGGIDLFIANAGYANYGLVIDSDWVDIERLFNLNVVSVLYSLRRMAVINPEVDYSVVITASAMAELAIPGYAYYGATKAALLRFAQAYEFERPENCHLMMVYPISTRTNFFNNDHIAAPVLFPSQSADFVAGRILAGIRNDKTAVRPSLLFRLYAPLFRSFPVLGRIYQQYGFRRFEEWIIRRSVPHA